jgi:hypothetical protein
MSDNALSYYQLTRIFDNVSVKDGGQERVWKGAVSKIYSGTVAFAIPRQVESVNRLEMDMRALLERKKIEVIGRDPSFEGIQILHDLQAQDYINKRMPLQEREADEMQLALSNWKTVVILRYTSGMTTMTEDDKVDRLTLLEEEVES